MGVTKKVNRREQIAFPNDTLVKQVRGGSVKARKLLIENHIWIAWHLAKQYSDGKNPSEDLLSIAYVGLVKAMNTFDPDRGVKPASYAYTCVTNEIRMYLRKNKREIDAIPLETPVTAAPGGKQVSLGDIIPAEGTVVDEVIRHERALELHQALDVLDAKERQVIMLRFGLGGNKEYTQREIAMVVGITQSYVSKMEKKALEKIKTKILKNFGV